MELHFIALPMEAYNATRTSSAIENLFYLHDLEIDTASPPRFDDIQPLLAAAVEEEENPKVLLEDLKYLVEKGAVPKDELSIDGYQWQILEELFEEAPTALGKCFGGGEVVGEFDAIGGNDVQLIATSLSELKADEEDLQSTISWLSELYTKAATNNWALLRWVA